MAGRSCHRELTLDPDCTQLVHLRVKLGAFDRHSALRLDAQCAEAGRADQELNVSVFFGVTSAAFGLRSAENGSALSVGTNSARFHGPPTVTVQENRALAEGGVVLALSRGPLVQQHAAEPAFAVFGLGLRREGASCALRLTLGVRNQTLELVTDAAPPAPPTALGPLSAYNLVWFWASLVTSLGR